MGYVNLKTQYVPYQLIHDIPTVTPRVRGALLGYNKPFLCRRHVHATTCM